MRNKVVKRSACIKNSKGKPTLNFEVHKITAPIYYIGKVFQDSPYILTSLQGFFLYVQLIYGEGIIGFPNTHSFFLEFVEHQKISSV